MEGDATALAIFLSIVISLVAYYLCYALFENSMLQLFLNPRSLGFLNFSLGIVFAIVVFYIAILKKLFSNIFSKNMIVIENAKVFINKANIVSSHIEFDQMDLRGCRLSQTFLGYTRLMVDRSNENSVCLSTLAKGKDLKPVVDVINGYVINGRLHAFEVVMSVDQPRKVLDIDEKEQGA